MTSSSPRTDDPLPGLRRSGQNDNQMYEPGSIRSASSKLQSGRDARLRHVVRFDPPGMCGRGRQLYLHVHRYKAFAASCFARPNGPCSTRRALLRSCASAHRTHPLRQHPEDRVIVDPQTVGRGLHRLVVQQHAFFGVARYDQGEITYFKHDTVNVSCGGYRTAETLLAADRDQGAGRRSASSNATAARPRAAGEEWVEPKKENPSPISFRSRAKSILRTT